MKNTEIPDSFKLEDVESNPDFRLTSKLAKRAGNSQTVHSQFRCPDFLSRRVDMILAAQLDPVLKTRSDIFIDALYQWVEAWDSRNPDGANGMMRAQFALHKMQIERAIRGDFLEEAKQQLLSLRQDGDIRQMYNLYQNLQMVYSDSLNDSPPSYTDELSNLISQIKRLIDAAE